MHEIQKWLRSIVELSKTGDEKVSYANDSHLHLVLIMEPYIQKFSLHL